jgi:hypothetical protein
MSGLFTSLILDSPGQAEGATAVPLDFAFWCFTKRTEEIKAPAVAPLGAADAGGRGREVPSEWRSIEGDPGGFFVYPRIHMF